MSGIDVLRDRLGQVLDPELGASILELGMLGDVTIDHEGHAKVVESRSRRRAARFEPRSNAT